MSEPRKTSRRDFLRGRSAADALAGAQSAVSLPETANNVSPSNAALEGAGISVPQSRESYLVRVGRRAMACEFEVLLNAGQYNVGTEAALAALDLVDELEAQLTVYRDTSEVSRLNQLAGAGPVEVEP